MKTIEQLLKLAKNPFYTPTVEEQQRIDDYNSGKGEAIEPKKKVSSKGNAIVKSVGTLNKHQTGPVKE